MLRIGSYNVRNLFLCGEAEAKPAHEVRALGRAIDKIAADVLVLQEVGSQDSLVELNEQLRNPSLMWLASLATVHAAYISRS